MTTLKEQIQSLFIGSTYKGATETTAELHKLTKEKMGAFDLGWSEYDSGIDDGADDGGEDKYVMYASFTHLEFDIDVTIYYGDVTMEIGYVEVGGEDLPTNEDEPTISTEDLNKEFKITSVCRADLEDRGFDVSNITDAQMEELAKRMCTDYLEQMFWVSLDIIAEDIMGFKKM